MEKKNSLLLKNIRHNDKTVNILIEGSRFASLDAAHDAVADRVIDCSGKAILPPFFNLHTHAAMTLLRGYADDMALHTWLNDYIWPYEATLTPHDIRLGSRLALLEMIKSGTVFFNDMYWDVKQTIEVAQQSGIRAAIGITFMDKMPQEQIERCFKFVEHWQPSADGRVTLAIAPHAIYTVGRKLFVRCAQAARFWGLKLHFHLSETQREVEDCLAAHGTTPVRLLQQWGVLGDNCIAAHAVHVDDEEIKILADAGVTVVHNPCSNMKLGSGIFPAARFIASGARIALGTDGCSSNNNLDMREETKLAALLAKVCQTPQTLPIEQAMQWATLNGAAAFGIDSGAIDEGKLADALIIDLKNERLMPCHNLLSNWVYSADGRCIDTLICDGRIVMQNGHVEGEEKILEEFADFFERRKK